MEELSKKNKRKARILVMRVLYSMDMDRGTTIEKAFSAVSSIDEALVSDGETMGFARKLSRYISSETEKIDGLIRGKTSNWDLERLSAIDRNILRTAVGELMGGFNTPLPVVINEAVEIAKEYGTDDSAKFINGVLDALKTEI